MTPSLNIPPQGALDFLSLGALVHRLDPGIVPFRKATECQIHVSGGEYNCAANLSDCFRLKTGIATAMVDYPIGDLIAERVRAMGVRPFYKHFKHNGVTGPNMATVYSDSGFGVRAPVVFYNRSNEAAAQLKPGDFDWSSIFSEGVRWFHSGGIFAALSETTGELIIEGMQAARASGAVTSFDLNYRPKLWNLWGGPEKAAATLGRIVENVDVLVGNEEDLQLGLGIPGPEAGAKSGLDPHTFCSMIDRCSRQVPPDQSRRHHLARGALDQPSFLGCGGLDQRAVFYLPYLRPGHLRPGGRRGWVLLRVLLRPVDWRAGTGSSQPGLGARRIVDHVSWRYHHGYC